MAEHHNSSLLASGFKVLTSSPRRALTPAEHARIRLQLCLLPIYVRLAFAWKDLLIRVPFGLPGTRVQFARDFIQFYLPGAIAAAHHRAALYDIDAWAAMVPRLVPGVSHLRFPPIYGPQISVLFDPIARLPYGEAMAVWFAITLAGYLACGYAVWRTCPRLRAWPATTALLLLGDPALHATLGFLQISIIGLASVTAAFLALRRDRRVVAGLALGMLVYKPQLALVAAFVFLCAGEWRIIGGTVAGAALQLAVGALFWGPSILVTYFRSAIQLIPRIPIEFEPYRFHMHSWTAFVELAGLHGWPARVIAIVISAAIAIVALRVWRSRATLGVRYAVLLLATTLVNPHMYVYDLLILMPAWLLLADWLVGARARLRTQTLAEILPRVAPTWMRRWSVFAVAATLLYLAYLSPLSGALAAIAHVQVSVIVLTALFGVAALRTENLERRTDDFGGRRRVPGVGTSVDVRATDTGVPANAAAKPGVLSRALSPAQHARIRAQIARLPVYIWLVWGWTSLLRRLPRVEPVRDFVHFYVLGVIARAHDLTALYDMNRMAAIVPRAVPGAHAAHFPPVYGPQVALIFAPLAHLSYFPALFTWLAASLLVYLACAYAIVRPRPALRQRAAIVALLLVAAPVLHFDLGFSQASAIGLASVTAGYLALRARRPFMAGLALGALAYKPPLGIAIAVVMIGAGEWRVILGALVTTAAELAAGAWYWGWPVLGAYLRALVKIPGLARGMEPYAYQMHSWRAFFDLVGLPGPVSMPLYLVVSIAILALALDTWRRRGPLALRYSVLLLADVLIDPHLYAYDLLLLTPAFLLLYDWTLTAADRPLAAMFPRAPLGRLGAWSSTRALTALLYFCYFSPLLGGLAAACRIQLSVPAFTLLAFAAASAAPAAELTTERARRETQNFEARSPKFTRRLRRIDSL